MLGKPESLHSEREAREDLARSAREQGELNRIGIALSSTRDIGKLLVTLRIAAESSTMIP